MISDTKVTFAIGKNVTLVYVIEDIHNRIQDDKDNQQTTEPKAVCESAKHNDDHYDMGEPLTPSDSISLPHCKTWEKSRLYFYNSSNSVANCQSTVSSKQWHLLRFIRDPGREQRHNQN